MRLIRSIASSSKGFTLIELLVSSSLGMLLIGLVLASVLANRQLFKQDMVRTRTNENIRGALDILGTDIRLGGESLGSAFPAIILANGSGVSADTLTVRRNLVAEVLPVCTALTAGSNAALRFAIPGTIAGCIYSTQTTSFNSWRSYRQANGNTVDAFIWDSSAKAGEFFKYTTETDGGTYYSITRSGSWSRNYPTASSAAYILEEWKFLSNGGGDELQLIRNQDAANPTTLAFDLDNFQVSILQRDGTTKTAFTTSDVWTNIKSLTVSITGKQTFLKQTVKRTLSASFFPRNVLSN